jgi:CheY-like chemotaxis protein
MSTNNVLLVDDNPDHVLLTCEAIASAHGDDVQVDVANDGYAAIEMLEKAIAPGGSGLPRLVLLDINMPGIDGFEVLRAIKQHQSMHVVPVVMLTSSEDEADIARSYGLGSNSYVTKPVDAEALRDRVSKIPSYWFDVNVSCSEVSTA